MGFFSSDRSIADYARDVWRVTPVPIAADGPAGGTVVEPKK
jgi:hypothetical protein